MATFKAVKYNTAQAAEGQLTAIYNYYKAKMQTEGKYVDFNVVTKWCNIIVGQDGTALIPYDDRVKDFPFNPNAIEEFSTTNTNYFPISEI